jgi:anti-sigma-K factor RskA
MNDQHIDDDLDAYALGVLDEADAARVRMHLRDCARCRELLAVSERAAAELLLSAPQVAPPPALRAKILTRARAMPLAGTASSQQSGLRQWLSQFLHTMRGDDSATDLLRRLAQMPDCVIWDVGGTADAPAAFARLVGTPHRKEAVLVTAGLASLSPDRVYQIWLLRDGSPLPNALFQVDATGSGQQIVRASEPLDRFDVVAVTPEPRGGSPMPTGPIVLMGQLAA